MAKKIYMGWDNGVSGSIAAVSDDGKADFVITPVKKYLNYTKVKGFINRVDREAVKNILATWKQDSPTCEYIMLVERPMVNPTRFKASMSALRCLEAQEAILEEMGIPYQFEDSKAWQASMLPTGLEGSDQLKEASLLVGKRLFPKIDFGKHKDADSLLMAAWARKMEQRTL